MRRARPNELRLYRAALRRWHGPRLPDGLPKRRRARPEQFDRDQLAIGVAVELEHTNKPEVAMEIAMAHLLERRDYYARLERYVESDRPSVRKSGVVDRKRRDPKSRARPREIERRPFYKELRGDLAELGEIYPLAGLTSCELHPILDELAARGLDLQFVGPGDRYQIVRARFGTEQGRRSRR